jgi:cellular nucleic acid-binding protein
MSLNKLYVLALERGKYYVGRSEYKELRLIQHSTGKGSAWTSKFHPVSIVEIRECKSPFEEDMVTKEYMAKYGIDNVRGGSYVKIVLDSIQLEAITRELLSVSDLCKSCGKSDHFIGECHEKKIIPITTSIIWLCEFCNTPFTSKINCITHESICSKQMLHSAPQE